MFEVLLQRFSSSPFFTFSKKTIILRKGKDMLHIKLKKILKLGAFCFLASLFLFAADAYADTGPLFGDLTSTGSEIFMGMREIVYAVSGFGIVAVAVGGFFGNLNWKWLSAIIIGLVIIAVTGGIINYMTGDTAAPSISGIHDSLIKG